MGAMGLFLISVAIFVALAAVSYLQLKGQFSRRYGDLETRFKSVEKSYERTLNELEKAKQELAAMQETIDKERKTFQEREQLLRAIMPGHVLTVMDVLRFKNIVNQKDIDQANEHIVATGSLEDVETVLSKWNKVSQRHTEEARAIVSQFNTLLAKK